MTTPTSKRRTVGRTPTACGYLKAVDDEGLLICAVTLLGGPAHRWRIHVFRPDRHDRGSDLPWTTLHTHDAVFPGTGADVDVVVERVRGLLLAHAEGYGVLDGVEPESARALAAA
jgi:hypothetical protein